MKTHALALTVAAAALLSLSACNNKNNASANGPQDVQSPKAEKAAGDKTMQWHPSQHCIHCVR